MSVFTWNSARDARGLLAAAACAAAALCAAPVALAGDEEGCLGCHGLPGLAVREGGEARSLGIAGSSFDASMHSDLGCRECHTEIASIPHGENRDPACGQPCHGRSTGGKEYSHEGLYWEFTASAHGGAKSRKIGCLLCHPSPVRQETAGRDKLGEASRCASCHRGNAKVRAWFSDRHYLALAGGNRNAPSCPDCHSSHRIRPASAPESTVNPARLADTCSSGAMAAERRGACHGALGAAAVAGAGMNSLPGGGTGGGALGLAFNLLAGLVALGCVARAGIGLVRGR